MPSPGEHQDVTNANEIKELRERVERLESLVDAATPKNGYQLPRPVSKENDNV